MLCCAAVAGCGGSGPTGPPWKRVCDRARAAAARTLGNPVDLQVINRDPADIECHLKRAGVRVDVVAQASTQAWTEYDTATVHLVQAFSGSVYREAQLPVNVSIPKAIASWVPAQQELLATNGTESSAGSYLTVSLAGEPKHWRSGLSLARAVAAAALAVAPRGPNPGPPPS